ncbi:MAG: hypothetical protein LW832_07905 [Parachlamydia sp.]|jgi:hypothetical protein|nr:hypothetical protein [Parachlamydia sp.]
MQLLKKLLQLDRQTKFFIFNLLLYAAALIWTTAQAYARLDYSRSNVSKPMTVRIPKTE